MNSTPKHYGPQNREGWNPDRLPVSDGKLEDGTPIYRLDTVAKLFGISLQEAEAAVQVMLAECEALGLPASDFVVDATQIHVKQTGHL